MNDWLIIFERYFLSFSTKNQDKANIRVVSIKFFLNGRHSQNKFKILSKMTKEEPETLLSQEPTLRIIEGEEITVEIAKETDEEITKRRFF